jgi:hypothetical protein
VLKISGAGIRTHDGQASVNLTAIPYAVWNNRGNQLMRVWLPCDAAQIPAPSKPTIASMAKVSVSFVRPEMYVARINDQLIPLNATDSFAKAFDFWPQKGTTEWIQYDFDQPTKVSSVTVSWFDDLASGGDCALPASWRVLARSDSGAWEPVKNLSDYAARKSDLVKVAIEPVTTKALRLEVQLQHDHSSGVYEWVIE